MKQHHRLLCPTSHRFLKISNLLGGKVDQGRSRDDGKLINEKHIFVKARIAGQNINTFLLFPLQRDHVRSCFMGQVHTNHISNSMFLEAIIMNYIYYYIKIVNVYTKVCTYTYLYINIYTHIQTYIHTSSFSLCFFVSS